MLHMSDDHTGEVKLCGLESCQGRVHQRLVTHSGTRQELRLVIWVDLDWITGVVKALLEAWTRVCLGSGAALKQ